MRMCPKRWAVYATGHGTRECAYLHWVDGFGALGVGVF